MISGGYCHTNGCSLLISAASAWLLSPTAATVRVISSVRSMKNPQVPAIFSSGIGSRHTRCKMGKARKYTDIASERSVSTTSSDAAVSTAAKRRSISRAAATIDHPRVVSTRPPLGETPM